MGFGHLSAARTIEAQIKARDSQAEVVIKDIRDFMPRWYERFDRFLFWFIVKRFPNVYTRLYEKAMNDGNSTPTLDLLRKDYDEVQLLAYLKKENPDRIIATHYGSALSLGNLREHGDLTDTPISWYTGEFIRGFFPRISQRLDKTYLLHEQNAQVWQEQGVPAEKYVITGPTLRPDIDTPVNRDEVLRAAGLDPQVPTIVISSGLEGVGDFPTIVESIGAAAKGPIQIIVNCAKNEKHIRKLNALQALWRTEGKNAHVRLLTTGVLPQPDLFKFIRSADVYITKGGYGAPEGFVIGKPMVLLDIYGGHERENVGFYERLGLALATQDQSEVGGLVRELLTNAKIREKMALAQGRFRSALTAKPFVDFVFEPQNTPATPVARFGQENGEPVGRLEAMRSLDRDASGDVELLLSYAIGRESYLKPDGFKILRPEDNPLGHLALRIDGTVYSVNGYAGRDGDPFVSKSDLSHYLYGINRIYKTDEFTSGFGLAYGRHVMGLRIRGMTPAEKSKLIEEVQRLEKEYANGDIAWKKSGPNCVDFTDRILRAAGLTPHEPKRQFFSLSMPVDYFERYLDYFDDRPRFDVDVVSYSKIQGAQTQYNFSKFPLSLWQVRRSIGHWRKNRVDPLELRTTKRVAAYLGAEGLVYENVDESSDFNFDVHERAVATSLETWRKDLDQEREQLKDAWSKMAQAAFTPEAQILALKELDSGFSSEERSAIFEERWEAIPEARRERARSLSKLISEIDESQQEFQLALDGFYRRSIDYLMETYFQAVDGMEFRLGDRLEKPQLARVATAMKAVREEYLNYSHYRDLYGQAKDFSRTKAISDFFAAIQSLAVELERAEDPSSQSRAAGEHASDLMARAETFFPMVPDGLRFLSTLFFNAKSGPEKTPVTDSLGELLRAQAKREGYKIYIEGEERIPEIRDARTINIYVPTHRQPELDVTAHSHLEIGPYLLVGHPDAFGISKIVTDAITRVDSFITVGRGSGKPLDQTMQRLREGKARQIMIYPEATTSFFHDTRPLREKFATGFLRPLREAGYSVNLIPISYPENSRILGKRGDEYSKTIRVVVGRPLLAAELEHLVALHGDQALNRWVRASWLGDLQKGAFDLFAQPDIAGLHSEINGALFAKTPHARAVFERSPTFLGTKIPRECAALLKKVSEK